MMTRTLISIAVYVVLGTFSLAHAQFLFNSTRPLTLTLSPQYPSPGQTVQASIQSYALDLDRSEITWKVDGKVVQDGAGITDITFSAGSLGSVTNIEVVAIDGEGNPAKAEASIRPSKIDLLWSTDSYTPPFYKGRALPGTGSTIRAYALAGFKNTHGLSLPESSIIYTWKRNDTILTEFSGRGKSSIVVPGPSLYGSDTITVEAESVDRAWKNTASVTISAQDPSVLLYENHPLFGILYHRAIIGDVQTQEREQKVTAVPYFAHILTPSDEGLSYDWAVNNTPTQPNPAEPQTLTITANNYTGPAAISLSITNAADFVMRATGAWRLIFGEGGNSFFSPSVNGFGQ